MKFLDWMRDRVWKLEKKHRLVISDLVKQFSGYPVGNPVVSEVVLGNRLVVSQDRDHLFLDLLFYRISNIFLIPQDMQLNVGQVQLLQLISTAVDCSQNFICSFILKRVSHQLQSS